MISIRPFDESDNQSMLEIERLCPQGDENCAIGVDKEDIIARYRMYDNWTVLVAEEAGKIAGWVGLTLKENPKRQEKYAYLTEVMVHPTFRRAGVATLLVREVEKQAQEMGSSYIYGYIYEPNKASQSLFSKLGYSKVRDIKFPAISTYKKAAEVSEYSIKPIDKKVIDDAVDLINEYNSNFVHFMPFTGQIFEKRLKSVPSYGADNFWVVRDKENKIVACAGLWDSSKMADLYYARAPTVMKIMRSAFGILNHITKMPKIPAEGEHFRFLYIADYAFDKEKPDAMLALLNYLNNFSIDRKLDYLMAVIDPEDDFIVLVKKFKPQIETWSVFARSFKGELPAFSPFYTTSEI